MRNYWEHYSNSENGNPLVNGTVGVLKNSFESFVEIPRNIRIEGERRFPIIISDFISDSEEIYPGLNMDKKMILEGQPTLSWKDNYKVGNFKRGFYRHLIPLEFTYGYAITCHKSQGSEWNKVLIIEENFPFNKEEHARWLYTAVTRASEKLVLVRK